MKGRDLIKRIDQIARSRGQAAHYTEGAGHTKVQIGQAVTFVPRHKEIKEPLAQAILRTLEKGT